MNSREGYPKVELSALEQRILRERLASAFSLKKIRVAEAMAEDESAVYIDQEGRIRDEADRRESMPERLDDPNGDQEDVTAQALGHDEPVNLNL